MKYFSAVIFIAIPAIVSLFVALSPTITTRSSNDRFEAGLSAYKDSKWDEAKTIFFETSQNPSWKFSSYYNLGNISARQGHIGEALGYYRRAQRLNPLDRDVIYNIELLTKQGGLRSLGDSSNVFDSLRNQFLDRFTLIQSLAVFILISGIFFTVVYFEAPFRLVPAEGETLKSRTTNWKLILPLVFMVLIIGISCLKFYDETFQRCTAIEKKLELKSGPAASNATIFEVPEGTELVVESKSDDWLQVVTNQGASGWVPIQNVMITSGTL